MFAALLIAAGAFAGQPGKGDPPAKLELFGAEDFYKGQEGKEQDFVGVLKKAERGKGIAGFGRFNPFRLEMAGNQVREVYVGGKPNVLDPYVGKRVKIVGKPVDLEVEGRNHREIWPARLELLPAAKDDKGKM